MAATAPAIPADIAAALRYGPQTQSAISRSRYLADALKSIQESGQNIGTPTELWTKLLAEAVTSWGKDRADRQATTALKGDQDRETADAIARLSGGLEAPAASTPPATAANPPAPPPADIAAAIRGVPTVDAPRRPPAAAASLEDARAAISQAAPGSVFTSGFRTPEHNAEVGGVPNSYHTRGQGQALDFVPPQGVGLDQVKSALQSRGFPVAEALNEGNHFHLAWNGAGAAPDPAVGLGGPPQQNIMPPQAAQAGAQQPGGGMPAPGAAPVGQPPQAAAGAVVTMGITPQQVDLAKRLLSDPRTHEAGLAYAMKLQQQHAEAVKQDTVTINGVPYGRNPYTNALTPIAIPDGARTQVMSAQEAGNPTAPAGVYVQRDPLGNIGREVPGAPPPGYAATAQGYAPVRGGPADPYRAQAPQQGYQYSGAGQQAPIAGGPADPRAPENLIKNTAQIRSEIQPVIDIALKLRRNMDSVRVGISQGNGVGDIQAINGLQRLIDEGVVREGDVALQLKGQGLNGGVAGLKGYLTSEGFFADPAIRQKILSASNALYSTVNENYKTRVLGYRSMADRAFGAGTFDNYVLSPDAAAGLGFSGAPAAPPAPNPAVVAPPSPGTTAAAIAEARRRGLIHAGH